MEYRIHRIQGKEEIGCCEPFGIEHYLWDSRQKPKTCGRAGYIAGKGIFVQMCCEESEPRRVFRKNRDMVWMDSAVEAFFAFPEDGEALSNESMYINFEMNANGALYAAYGKGRQNRIILPERYEREADCRAVIEPGRWTAEMLIPEGFLSSVCDLDGLLGGKVFYCNFYKISETEEIRHFGCFHPIESDVPNFHLPVYFAETVIG